MHFTHIFKFVVIWKQTFLCGQATSHLIVYTCVGEQTLLTEGIDARNGSVCYISTDAVQEWRILAAQLLDGWDQWENHCASRSITRLREIQRSLYGHGRRISLIAEVFPKSSLLRCWWVASALLSVKCCLSVDYVQWGCTLPSVGVTVAHSWWHSWCSIQ